MGSDGEEKNHATELSEFFSFRKIADATFDYNHARYVIFGVPFDGTSSFRRGSRLAPDSIRLAYDNLESYEFSYDVDLTSSRICDLGNITVGEDASEVVDTVETVTRMIFSDGKIPIMLGGEHSVTVGAVRNFKDASMIIIDAHSDFRMEYMGNPLNHACVTRRSLEILGKNRIFSIGTRSVSKEERESKEWGDVTFVPARKVREEGVDKILREIDPHTDKIYFSIDTDGIDPAYAPGVGTPEPYGLTDVDVRSMIEYFAKRIIGFDIVEITPVYDNGNTSMLAAKLIQNFIASRETSFRREYPPFKI